MKNKILVITHLRGQAIGQYLVIFGLVAMAGTVMGTGVRRTIQAVYKNVSDKIGPQDGFAPDPKKGFVDLSVNEEHLLKNTTHKEDKGDVILEYNDATVAPFSQTNSHYGNMPD